MMTGKYKGDIRAPYKLKSFCLLFLFFLLIIIICEFVSELKPSSRVCEKVDLPCEEMSKEVLHWSPGPQANSRVFELRSEHPC